MKKLYKKSQSALEFVILICFVIFFFSVIFLIINEKYSLKVREDQDRVLNNIINNIGNEINLASRAGDGYSRTFLVPESILGKKYEINISEGFVYARTDDLNNAAAIPIFNITGNIRKGSNTIRKQGDIIYLN